MNQKIWFATECDVVWSVARQAIDDVGEEIWTNLRFVKIKRTQFVVKQSSVTTRGAGTRGDHQELVGTSESVGMISEHHLGTSRHHIHLIERTANWFWDDHIALPTGFEK